MAAIPLTDARIFAGAYDYSGKTNRVQFDFGAAMLDGTVFGNTTKVNTPGLYEAKGQVDGLWDAAASGDVQAQAYANIGSAALVTSLAPSSADGQVGYTLLSVQSKMKFFGAVGQLPPFSFAFDNGGSAYAARGQVLLPETGVVRSTSSNGTFQILGAVGSSQHLVLGLHVVAATALTSLVFKVQSSVDNTFASPTDQITSATYAAIGSERQAVIGPITDTYFRIKWTLTGTSFKAFAVVAIV